MEISFTPFPDLETDRLLLRQISLDDDKEIFFLRSDSGVLKHIKRAPAKSMDEAREWINTITENIRKNEAIIWAITLKGDPKLIGNIILWKMRPEHFRAETGYMLHPDFQRKGIMNEALAVVLDYAFHKLGFHSIEALVDPENPASIRLLEKNNFVREAYYKEDFFFDGEFLDTAVYSLLKKNWNK